MGLLPDGLLISVFKWIYGILLSLFIGLFFYSNIINCYLENVGQSIRNLMSTKKHRQRFHGSVLYFLQFFLCVVGCLRKSPFSDHKLNENSNPCPVSLIKVLCYSLTYFWEKRQHEKNALVKWNATVVLLFFNPLTPKMWFLILPTSCSTIPWKLVAGI